MENAMGTPIERGNPLGCILLNGNAINSYDLNAGIYALPYQRGVINGRYHDCSRDLAQLDHG